MAEMILALVRDLMFSSKISSAAKGLNVAVKIIRDPEKLWTEAGGRLIVDLNQPGALEAAVLWKQSHPGLVIGFVSHVDQETIQRAREAGIDRVMPRSQFVQQIAELMS